METPQGTSGMDQASDPSAQEEYPSESELERDRIWAEMKELEAEEAILLNDMRRKLEAKRQSVKTLRDLSTQQSGTTVKFNPPAGQDTMVKKGVTQNINTKHQCITAMKQYESKSPEELRFEDYVVNRKGKQAGETIYGFGTTPAATQLATGFTFGQTNPAVFGASSGFHTSTSIGTRLFGQPAGQTGTSLFGTKPFGTTTTTQSVGFGLVGTNTDSVFGQPQQTMSLFPGLNTQCSLFSKGTSAFGSTTSSGFGGFGGFGTTSQLGRLFGNRPTTFGTSTTSSTTVFNFGDQPCRGCNQFVKPFSTQGFDTGLNTPATYTGFEACGAAGAGHNPKQQDCSASLQKAQSLVVEVALESPEGQTNPAVMNYSHDLEKDVVLSSAKKNQIGKRWGYSGSQTEMLNVGATQPEIESQVSPNCVKYKSKSAMIELLMRLPGLSSGTYVCFAEEGYHKFCERYNEPYEENITVNIERQGSSALLQTKDFVKDLESGKALVRKQVKKSQFRRDVSVALLKLDNRNISKLIGLVQHPKDGVLYIDVFLEKWGTTLDAWMSTENEVPNIRGIVRKTLEGLVYLHSKGIVNMNIKPNSICAQIDHGEVQIKLTDFDLVKLPKRGIEFEGSSLEPEYMSPELCQYYLKIKLDNEFSIKLEDITGKADVFSLSQVTNGLYTKRSSLLSLVTGGEGKYKGLKVEEKANICLMTMVAYNEKDMHILVNDKCDLDMRELLKMMMLPVKQRPTAEVALKVMDIQDVIEHQNKEEQLKLRKDSKVNLDAHPANVKVGLKNKLRRNTEQELPKAQTETQDLG